MRKSRGYIRELSNHQKDLIRKFYKDHKGSGLSNKERKILIGLAKRPAWMTESELMYRIREAAINDMIDLELIAKVAHIDQLKEIFRPLDGQETTNIDMVAGVYKKGDFPKDKFPKVIGKYVRTDWIRIMDELLHGHDNQDPSVVKWKEELAAKLLKQSVDYLRMLPRFSQKSLYQRLFNDVIDSIKEN